ncbi:tripartite tricarboxylate transporter TctB family protein [Hominifimenecus sp. rT4P-3]|uniref:tripartite tricarboxylate transporter TctB family protein n=1 Tax=Hominifimenecus sp. rT4P-3 TaxID=3242979 RepID=UPI003DA46810
MDREKRTFAFREYLLLVILTAVSALAFAGSLEIFSQKKFAINSSGTFPTVMSGLMLLCCLIALIGTPKRLPKDVEKYSGAGELIREAAKEEVPRDVLISILMVIVYMVALGLIGFIPSSLIFILAIMFYLSKGKRKAWVLLLSGTGSVAAIYVVFRIIFKVLLP